MPIIYDDCKKLVPTGDARSTMTACQTIFFVFSRLPLLTWTWQMEITWVNIKFFVSRHFLLRTKNLSIGFLYCTYSLVYGPSTVCFSMLMFFHNCFPRYMLQSRLLSMNPWVTSARVMEIRTTGFVNLWKTLSVYFTNLSAEKWHSYLQISHAAFESLLLLEMDDNKNGRGELSLLEASWRNNSAMNYNTSYSSSEMVIRNQNETIEKINWVTNLNDNWKFQQISPHPASSYAAMMIFTQAKFALFHTVQ